MLEDRGDIVHQVGEAGSGHLYGSGYEATVRISVAQEADRERAGTKKGL